MKTWKHFIFEQRKVISSSISHKSKVKNIGENLSINPTSILKKSKETELKFLLD